MERLNTKDSKIIEVPEDIDEQWLADFTEKYGGEQFEITIKAQDWLVQPEDETSSAYYAIEDLTGPGGSTQTIKGTIHNAAITDTPQYFSHSTGPVVALLNARLIFQSGREWAIVDATRDKKDIPEEVYIEPGERMVLVRLDNAVLKNEFTVTPLD